MKKLFIFGIFSFILLTTHAQKNDLPKVEKIHGNIRSFKETVFRVQHFNNGTEKKEMQHESLFRYDRRGNITEERLTTPSQRKTESTSKEQSTQITNLQDLPIDNYYYTYLYDEMGRCIEKTIYESPYDNIVLFIMDYEYDRFDDCVKKTVYDTADNVIARHALKYDYNHRCVEERIEYTKNDRGSVTSFQYDNRGRCIEVFVKSLTGDFVSKITYEYDEKGHLISESHYASLNKCSSYYTNFYNGLGIISKREGYYVGATGSITDKRKFISEKYNLKGFLAKQDYYITVYGGTYTYKYVNDDYGNWTERSMYFQNNKQKPVFEEFIYREIDYWY